MPAARAVAVTHAVPVAAGAFALTALLAACGPDAGLRVEQVQVQQAPQPTETVDAGPPDQPFDAVTVRDELLDNPSVTNVDGYDEVHDVVLACDECLSMDRPLIVGGKKFQMAKVTAPTDHKQFAAVIVANENNSPKIELILSGNDLSVQPGRGGTLVAQESVFRPTDEPCCASGWSVQVFRYRDGKFEAGQRIGQLD